MSSQIVENLFLSGHKSDISFYVGKDKSNATRFPAHKCFMTLGSPVFSAMFNENFKENVTGEVLITDVTPMAFKAVLRFIYTGKFNENINVCDINDILYASNKYMLKSLTKCCLKHLEKRSVDVDDFWIFYSIISTYFSELLPASLVSKTLTCLSTNSKKLLQRDESETINHDSLNFIVNSYILNIDSELSVYDFVLRWSVMACCRQNLDVTPENQRQVLGNVLYEVRYLLMSWSELENGPLNSKILTEEEKAVIIDSMQSREIVHPFPWNGKLLKCKRKYPFTLSTFFPVTQPSSDKSSETSMFFVLSKDVVLSDLLVMIAASSFCTAYVKGYISGLDGWLIKSFSARQPLPALNGTPHLPSYGVQASLLPEATLLVPIEVCLKAFKCYKLSLLCKGGFFVMRNQRMLQSMEFGKGKFFIGMPNKINELRSEQFWKRFFSSKVYNIPNTINHPIKRITVVQKW